MNCLKRDGGHTISTKIVVSRKKNADADRSVISRAATTSDDLPDYGLDSLRLKILGSVKAGRFLI